jgi:dihydrofolate synthase/folylpolyglutamate synthase
LSGDCGFGLVFAAVRDKSFDEMCRLISEAGLFDSIVVTQVGGSRRLAAQELAADLGLHGVSVSRSFGDSRRAYEYVLEDSEKSGRQWFFAGSLYLVGEIMGYVG